MNRKNRIPVPNSVNRITIHIYRQFCITVYFSPYCFFSSVLQTFGGRCFFLFLFDGEGGIGLTIGGKEYSIWYNELGMQIAVGHTVHDRILDKAFLSWEEVTGRIHQLLRQGEYAPQVVLDAARENAVKEHAQALVNMERDMAEGVAELVFEDEQVFRGGFPEVEERVGRLLEQPEYLSELNERLEGLAEAYSLDKEIMRFHYYRPDKVLAQFQKFAKEAVPYQAREDFQWQEHDVFITQDEIDAFLTRGGAYSDGRLATYAFFIQDKSDKEKADFIKERYGIGGQSHALSGADNSHADYNGKGLKLERGIYGNPDTSVLLKWPAVAKRVQYLIENDRYLKAADYARMPVYEREQIANRIIGFYFHLPKEIERPFTDELFHEKARKELPVLLENPDTAEELVAKMDAALAALPLDFEEYDKKVETLSVIHQYVEGTYTIFPEQKKEVEIEGSTRQLSLFDFMDVETPVKEPDKEIATPEKKPDRENSQKEETAEKEEPEQEDSATDIADKEFSLEEQEEHLEDAISEAMEKSGTHFVEFSPEQIDVIYASAEKGIDIVPMLKPEFSPAQMQLIADVMERVAADSQAAIKKELDPLTTHVMNPDSINTVRRFYHLPLEPEGKEDAQSPEIQIEAQQDGEESGEIQQSTEKVSSEKDIPENTGDQRELVNFRITDDDLGAGGPKQKFRANMEAVRLRINSEALYALGRSTPFSTR